MFRTRLVRMVESDNVPNPYQKVTYGKPSPLITALEQAPRSRAIAGSVGAAAAISFILWALMTGSGDKVPTMSADWEATTKAYMKHYKMNPIFGISREK